MGLTLFIKDWQHILKHKMATIAVGILLLMPLVYAGLFVAGYWDPYGKLDQFPVAVVNLDQGANMSHTNIHIGNDMVTDLKGNKNLDLHFVSKDRAEKGLKKGDYFLIISIPKNFSENIATISDEHPQKAKLEYKINQGKNFVAGQISSQVAKEIYDKVSTEITKSYTETIFSNLKDMGNGFEQASNGATKIHEGTSKAKNGASNLKDGASQLARGEKQLSDSTVPLTEGVDKLSDSLSTIKSGSDSLTTGLGELNNAGGQLETGATSLVSGVTQLKSASDTQGLLITELEKTKQSLTTKLDEYINKNSEAKDDETIKAIQSEIQIITGLLNKMQTIQTLQSNGITKVRSGQEDLAKGLHSFDQHLNSAYLGSQKLTAGLTKFSSGMTKWNEGFHTFSSGVISATNGSEKILDGTSALVSGMQDLTNGTGELSDKLNDAANKSSNIHSDANLFSMFSRPVDLQETVINEVENYGTSMVPYFLTLGLFVGGLIASNVVPFERESKIPGVSGWQHFVNKFCLYASFAFIQTIIVDIVILFGFDVHVYSIPKFLILSLLAALTYVTFILMLVSIFGGVGKLGAIILLVTQLVTCGGTFPIELASQFIQAINKFLPMTYAVNSFRSVISTREWNVYWNGIGILFSFTFVFALIACLLVVKANQKEKLVTSAG
ncbi:YhgE/Pip family protein [Gottfriedia solisilvae]|uniref:Phage infection protein n=1 Tax=Gottfriedia solisilvae TaxID=1516104 RepID=A0A8J3AEB1_9BACI|nr:YhgE/Pip domain-containing protein [Gottfriedia solisilvae]GGI10445.1 phage infection protein [Gottfriedia solisilvae]